MLLWRSLAMSPVFFSSTKHLSSLEMGDICTAFTLHLDQSWLAISPESDITITK